MESVQGIIEFVRLWTLVTIDTSAEGNFKRHKKLQQVFSSSKQQNGLTELF